jgi:hypothetical protein
MRFRRLKNGLIPKNIWFAPKNDRRRILSSLAFPRDFFFFFFFSEEIRGKKKMALATVPTGMGAMLHDRLLNNNTMLTGNSAGKLTGEINMSSVYRNLAQVTGLMPARGDNYLAEVDAGNRNIGYTDIRADYGDRFLIKQGSDLTAKVINNRNIPILVTSAVLIYTEEMNYIIQKEEILQTMFQRVAEGGLGRISGYKRSKRTGTIDKWKKSQRWLMTMLEDPNFGATRWRMGLSSIEDGATQTAIGIVSAAQVDTPYTNLMVQLNHPSRTFSHIRQGLMSNEECLMAHDEPDLVLQAIYRKMSNDNGINLAIFAEGSIGILNDIQGESRPMQAWKAIYNPDKRGYLVIDYAGPNSYKSLTSGKGMPLNLMENTAITVSVDDGMEDRIQTHRTKITLGEFATMNHRDYALPFSGDPGELDIGLADHTPTQVRPGRVSYYKSLKASMLFNDTDGVRLYSDDGSDNKPELDHLTNALYILAAESNETATRKHMVREYFRNPDYQSNDEAPNEYLVNNVPLDQQYGFRHECFLLRWDDEDMANPVKVAEYIWQTEPKSLPGEHLMGAAECLAKIFATNKTTGIPAAFVAEGPAAVDEDLIIRFKRFAAKVFPTVGLITGLAPAAIRDLLVAICVPDADGDFQGAVINAAFKDRTYVDASELKGAEKAAFERAKEAFAKKPKVTALHRSALMPLTGEPLDTYRGRVTADHIRNVAANTGLNHSDDTIWTGMLAHVPDNGLDHFLTLAHTALSNDRDLTVEERDAVETFAGELEGFAGRAHATDLLRKAAALTSRADFSLTQLAPEKPWFLAAALTRLNKEPKPAYSLADDIAATAEDRESGMDIHAESGPTSAVRDYIPQRGVRQIDEAGRILPLYGDSPMLRSYSLQRYTEYAFQHIYPEASWTMVMYCFLLASKWCYRTCAALAQHGIELFNQVYVKPCIRMRTHTITLQRAGPDTMLLAVGHMNLRTGEDAAEGYLSVHAEMHMGVIVVEPKYMDFLPYAQAESFIGSRNNQFMRTPEDLYNMAANKRGLLPLPVPVNERRYVVPVPLVGWEPAYRGPNSDPVQPNQKGSWYPLFAKYYDEDTVRQLSIFEEEGSYHDYVEIATQLQRACTWYNLDRQGNGTPVAGSGPLGRRGRNLPGAERCYSGIGRFPDDFGNTLVVNS